MCHLARVVVENADIKEAPFSSRTIADVGITERRGVYRKRQLSPPIGNPPISYVSRHCIGEGGSIRERLSICLECSNDAIKGADSVFLISQNL